MQEFQINGENGKVGTIRNPIKDEYANNLQDVYRMVEGYGAFIFDATDYIDTQRVSAQVYLINWQHIKSLSLYNRSK